MRAAPMIRMDRASIVVLLDNGRSKMIGTSFGNAAMHSLRRVPQSLPGIQLRRRSRLWLGLSGPMRSSDTVSQVEGRDIFNASSFCGRCENLPDTHSAAKDDAAPAGQQFDDGYGPDDAQHQDVGILREAPGRIISRGLKFRVLGVRVTARGGSVVYRVRPDGRSTAISLPRNRVERFSHQWSARGGDRGGRMSGREVSRRDPRWSWAR